MLTSTDLTWPFWEAERFGKLADSDIATVNLRSAYLCFSAFVKSKTYFFISYQLLWHSMFLNGISSKLSRRANRYRTWWRVFVLILSLSTTVNAVRLRTVCHLLLQSMFVSNWSLLYIRIYRGFQFVLAGTGISSSLTMWFTLCIMRVMCVICNSIFINVDSQLYHLW